MSQKQRSKSESGPATTEARVNIPQPEVEEFCRQNHIEKLSLFGSVIRDDFTPNSDIDVLVEFEPGHVVGLIKLGGMHVDLSEIFGREVDINTPNGLSRYYRDEVLSEALVIYDET